MTTTATATRTSTSTTTEARVRYVMAKVMANFNALVIANLITRQSAEKWNDDLSVLQMMDALESFQVQFANGSASPYCLNFAISNDGSIQQDAASGGLDFYGIAKNTPVTLCLRLRPAKYDQARKVLEDRGWTFNGKLIEASSSETRSFGSGGYAITRSKRGNWP